LGANANFYTNLHSGKRTLPSTTELQQSIQFGCRSSRSVKVMVRKFEFIRRHESRRETNSSLNVANSLSLINGNENASVSIKIYCTAYSVNIRLACQTLVPSSSLLQGYAFVRGCFLEQTSTAVPWAEVTFCNNTTFNLLFETRLIMYYANCSYR
jgi:hypothetical protein